MAILREIGAHFTPDKGTVFTVWAPKAEKVEVLLHKPEPIQVPLQREAMGYWTALSEFATPGTRYTFVLDGETQRPDPASHFQPDGVHEPSAVVDHHAFAWTDKKWKNLPLHEYIIYELHVGTFTPEGTFESMIERLPELKELGVTAIEIMPVAQFPGSRNWGYDGVFPFAAQNSYGGPEGLKKLVNACHAQGLAVVLDVVYNHMGPEGNYLNDFGPYFTDKYKTPWGTALNFDDNHADAVRNFFFQNALMWLREYHIDALRLDAVHAIYDMSAKHFLQELQEHVQELEEQLGRDFILIAESDLNDVRLINPMDRGGYGLDAQWSDDFHHVIHALFTGEQSGYYVGFGKTDQLTKVMEKAFVYDGLYSEHRHRTFGSSTAHNQAAQFVVCSQNHDQVGNRMLGERLSELVDYETLKVIAALVILSPYQPMLFMGEEYGERNPFLYFVSHGDKDLIEAVRKGRREEFSAFAWQGEAPDPQSEETFERSKLTRSYTSESQQNKLREYYKRLLQLRKSTACLAKPDKDKVLARMDENGAVLHLVHHTREPYCYSLFNLSDTAQTVRLLRPDEAAGNWKPLLHSAAADWGGPGTDQPEALEQSADVTLPPKSVLVLAQQTH
ncbi:malto-oligosyltrehalose trehalohydrolase [Pontibacter actiniarum]|uniref:Malto-oligosyltrehalose trehalohydrolase n=1 Tax=Pontibacter actiniarum TaxID=323450 RepID=A0A1X9YST7_9BACT|nr:malto-oligosyltrehalose trehalohydrolase [Pontibacter actiniarum]ARS35949.1 malto-oligosyltrehalose trehalohydrolase [Pontibacter actiniarum]